MRTEKFMEQKVKDLTVKELLHAAQIKLKQQRELAKPEPELTVVEEMKNFPERYETLTSDFGWEDFVSFYGQKIKILCKKWNYFGLNRVVFHICTNEVAHEIIRRKKQ